MITAFLILALIVLFYFRIYFYERGAGENKLSSFTSTLTRIYSIKYLIPISYKETEELKIKQYKKKSNIFLYCFYIGFAVVLIYISILVILGKTTISY